MKKCTLNYKVIFLITIFLIFVLVGCDRKENESGGDIESVVSSFIQKVQNEEYSVALQYCANQEDGESLIGLAKWAISEASSNEFVYSVTTKNSSQGKVQVSTPQEHLCYVEVENIEGSWKIVYVD